jgi:hypothetical protein
MRTPELGERKTFLARNMATKVLKWESLKEA